MSDSWEGAWTDRYELFVKPGDDRLIVLLNLVGHLEESHQRLSAA